MTYIIRMATPGRDGYNHYMSGRGSIEEELRTYVELLKIITAFLIAIGSGTATLFINLDSGTKAVLFLIGLAMVSFLTAAFMSFLLRINSLIRRLKE